VLSRSIDGREAAGGLIPAAGDGLPHTVEVTMGEGGA
jgi:hypothetical protein